MAKEIRLTDEQASLIVEHLDFYQSLDSGERKPKEHKTGTGPVISSLVSPVFAVLIRAQASLQYLWSNRNYHKARLEHNFAESLPAQFPTPVH